MALLFALPLTVCADAPTVTVSIYSCLEETYIAEPQEIEWREGMTPFSILRELDVEFSHNSGYVTSMAGLREKANGPYSGWVYAVDGERPQGSAAQYKLQSGQVVEWIYAVTAEQAGLTVSSEPVSSEITSSEPTASVETSSAAQVVESEPVSVAAESVAASSIESVAASSEPAETSSGSEMVEIIQDNPSADTPNVEQAFADAVDWLEENPGDWAALVLAMAGRKIPDELLPKADENERITDTQRRLIVGGAAGIYTAEEKSEIAEQIAAYSDLYHEGLNSVIFASIAHQSAGRADLASDCVDYLLIKQRADGGFALYDELDSDIDLTAMALYALLTSDSDKTADAAARAQEFLLGSMNPDGSFGAPANCESTAQALMALTVCRTDAAVLDQIAAALCGFATDSGGFAHLAGEAPNVLSTEQAAMALYTYQNHQLPYYITTETPDRAPDLWVLLPIGAVLLIGAGGLAVYRLRKGNSKADE